MPIKQKLTANGINYNAANVIAGIPKTGLTATGTNQGTALALSLDDIQVINTTAAGTGAIIPILAPGDSMKVSNQGANDLLLYPPSGHKFNSQANDASITITATKTAFIQMITTTAWIASVA